jgi:prefoldin subunit 5
MILKARIHELEDAVNSIGDKRMVAESGSRNISDYQNRYKEMEDELVNVQNYKMRLNDMQMEMNRLFQDNEELRKELIAR